MNLAPSRCGVALGKLLGADTCAPSDARISETIGLARITLIVGLVFLHYRAFPNSDMSPFDGIDAAQHQAATFVNSFILFFFFSVVPLLSMISGWLFFRLPMQPATGVLRKRIHGRFVSLYLPLVFWNALFLGGLAALYSLEPDYPLFGELNLRFAGASMLDYLNAVFGVTQHPIAFQFWFVRDLFVSALVSPLLLLLLRRAPYVGMALLGCAWLVGHDLLIFFRTDVVFFFYLGGFLRLRNVPLQIGRRQSMQLMGLYIALVGLRTLAPLIVDVELYRPEWLTGATRAMRLVGVLACWGVLLQLAPTHFGRSVARFGGLAFFLHAIHFPLLSEVKLRLWQWMPAETSAWMLSHYAASVAVTVAIGISTGLLLCQLAPRWFAWMNGGRALLVAPRAFGADPLPRASGALQPGMDLLGHAFQGNTRRRWRQGDRVPRARGNQAPPSFGATSWPRPHKAGKTPAYQRDFWDGVT